MAVAGKQSVIYAYDIYSQSGEMLLLHTAYRVLFAPLFSPFIISNGFAPA